MSKEKVYEQQLLELEKKGHLDREQNLLKLDMYSGDVNLVIMDYETIGVSQNNTPTKPPKSKQINTTLSVESKETEEVTPVQITNETETETEAKTQTILPKEELQALEQRQLNILSQLKTLDSKTAKLESHISGNQNEESKESEVVTQGEVTVKSVSETLSRAEKNIREQSRALDERTLPINFIELRNSQESTITKLENMFKDETLFNESQIENNIRLLMAIDDSSYKSSINRLEEYKLTQSTLDTNLVNELRNLEKRQDNQFRKVQQMSDELNTIATEQKIEIPEGIKSSNLPKTQEGLEQLERQQRAQWEQLVKLAQTIEDIAKEDNIELPERETVQRLIMSKDTLSELENQQQSLIERLEASIEDAKLLTETTVPKHKPTLSHVHSGSTHLEVPKDILEPKEPKDHYPTPEEEQIRQKSKSLSPVMTTQTENVSKSEEEIVDLSLDPSTHQTKPIDEFKDANIVVTTPKETLSQAHEFKRRRKSLQIGVKDLRAVFEGLDMENSGNVSSDMVKEASVKLNMLNKESSELPNYMKSIIKDVSIETNNNTSTINYNKLCEYLLEPVITDKLSNKDDWNKFREELIGHMKLQNYLRIYYHYDGWPKSRVIEIEGTFTGLNENKNDSSFNVSLESLREYIEKDANEKLGFAQLRSGTQGIRESKPKWHKVTETESQQHLPISFAKDGWAEIRLWFRTQNFVERKGGRPFPGEH